MKHQIDKFLDASGLLCPEPVMLLHKMVREVNSGSVIKVTATDPSTKRDIPNFCRFLGHELMDQEEADNSYVYYICKK